MEIHEPTFENCECQHPSWLHSSTDAHCMAIASDGRECECKHFVAAPIEVIGKNSL